MVVRGGKGPDASRGRRGGTSRQVAGEFMFLLGLRLADGVEVGKSVREFPALPLAGSRAMYCSRPGAALASLAGC